MKIENVADFRERALESSAWAGRIYVGRLPDLAAVGRPAGMDWVANPFKVSRHGTRDEVVAKYRAHLWLLMKNGTVSLSELACLAQYDLVCHCAPRKCHAEILRSAAEWAVTKIQKGDRS